MTDTTFKFLRVECTVAPHGSIRVDDYEVVITNTHIVTHGGTEVTLSRAEVMELSTEFWTACDRAAIAHYEAEAYDRSCRR